MGLMPQDIGIRPGTDMIYSSAVWSSATDPCFVPYLVPGHMDAAQDNARRVARVSRKQKRHLGSQTF